MYRTVWASGCIHFRVESAVRDKFMFTGAGFTSTLCNPLNVLYFLGADLTVYFEVSKLHSVMFITGPPTKKQGIIEPDCTQKTLWRFLSKLFHFPQLLDVSLTQSDGFVWFLAISRTTELFSFRGQSFSGLGKFSVSKYAVLFTIFSSKNFKTSAQRS